MRIQEYGITNVWLEEEDFELYVRRSMMSAARCESLWGFTWWCSHEFDPAYKDFDPAECHFGLLDRDNKPKPLALYVKRCIEDMKRGMKEPPFKTGVAIVVDENEMFDGWKYGWAYADLLRADEHGKFVLSSRADGKQYLAGRGISRLIKL